jgi:hypothetical protein
VPHARRLLVLFAALAAMLLSACQVRTEVAIDVEEDGSGTVTVTARLDEEAAGRLGDPATALRTDDLVAAGWRVEDPATGDDGALTLRAVRDFGSPDQLATVLDEVGGVDGVFRDAVLSIEDGFASTSYDFSSAVELSGDLEQFGDAFLTSSLGGLALARTPEELAAEGADDAASATLGVVVSLPGAAPETNGEVRGDAAVWEFPLTGGEATSATLTSSSTVDDSGTRTTILVGVLLVVVAAALAVLGLVLRRRDG